MVVFVFGASTGIGHAIGMVDTMQNLQTGVILGVVMALIRDRDR